MTFGRSLWGAIKRLALAGAAIAALGGIPAGATEIQNPGDFDGRPGPELYEFYNLLTGTSFDSNQDLELFRVEHDATCILGEATGVVLLGSDLGMANANDFGFYTDLGVGLDLTTIFSSVGPLGIAGPPYEASLLGFEGEAGFFLQAHGLNEDLWHSEEDIDIDADLTWFDHMVSYQLPDGLVLETSLGLVQIDGGSLIGWEDLSDESPFLDFDYNDMVLVKGTLTIIPEPATGLLVTLGLGALVLTGRWVTG